jgi:murein DD-endopeptidase MepM/ murein hydrolase activator NlpD
MNSLPTPDQRQERGEEGDLQREQALGSPLIDRQVVSRRNFMKMFGAGLAAFGLGEHAYAETKETKKKSLMHPIETQEGSKEPKIMTKFGRDPTYFRKVDHLGVDFEVKAGTDVFASMDGYLWAAGYDTTWPGAGGYVILIHELDGNNVCYSVYQHLELDPALLRGHVIPKLPANIQLRARAMKEQNIQQGYRLGKVAKKGSREAGHDKAVHLHYQILLDPTRSMLTTGYLPVGYAARGGSPNTAWDNANPIEALAAEDPRQYLLEEMAKRRQGNRTASR